jgi:hypothetical protein
MIPLLRSYVSVIAVVADAKTMVCAKIPGIR